MYRIKDPKLSIPFYENILGMTLVNVKHFEAAKFSLYFMGTFPEGTKLPDPTSEEADHFARSISGVLLELTHNHGTENQPDFKHHNGNTDPRGFGHIGFLVNNLEETCKKMENE